MTEIRRLTMILYFLKYVNGGMEPFIIGGFEADITNFPHSAFMTINCKKRNGTPNTWVCGGSILNQWVLITAAHCIEGCLPDSVIHIYIGSENVNDAQVFKADSFVLNLQYDTDTSYADIALVKINHRVNFSSKVKRVAIMPKPPYNEKAYVAGWGLTNEDEQLSSPYLKYLDQNVMLSQECNQRLKLLVPNRCICASSDNLSHYPGSGDSGSALVVRGFIQIGIVSFKIPEISNNLIVYTDVGKYYHWIRINSRRLICHNRL